MKQRNIRKSNALPLVLPLFMLASLTLWAVASASSAKNPNDDSVVHGIESLAAAVNYGKGRVAISPGQGPCTLAGTWKQTAENVGTSIWEVDNTGKANESGLGGATGTATLTGNKLRIDWKTSNGFWSGYYEWQLDSGCNSGEGELVFQSGASGTRKSTVTRQSVGAPGPTPEAPPSQPTLPVPTPTPIPPVDTGSSKGMSKYVNEPDHSPDKLDFGEVWNGHSSNRIFRLTANASGYVRAEIPTGPFRVAEIRELGPEHMVGGEGAMKGRVRDVKGKVTFQADMPGPWKASADAGNDVQIYLVFEPKFDLFQMTAGEKAAMMKVSGPGPKGDWAFTIPMRGMFNGLIVGAAFTVEDRDVMAVQGTERIDVAVRLTGTDSVLQGTIRGKNLPPGIQIDPVPATVNPAQTTPVNVPVFPDWSTLKPDSQPRNIELVFDAGEKSSTATFSLTPLPKKAANSGNPSPKISISDYDDPQKKQSNSEPPKEYEVPAGAITRLRITLVTGDDDLRYNSTVRAFLITQDDRRVESDALNCNKGGCDDPGLASHTRRTFEWNILQDAYVYPADIRRFGLSFESKSTSIFQTGDNWDLDELVVEYVVQVGNKTSPAGTFFMYKGSGKSGKPLYRFKTKEDWETEPLNLTH